MKLNYTSLQHAVQPVEDEQLQLPLEEPVAVLALHGQLAAVAWAFAQAKPEARLGFVQTRGRGAARRALAHRAHAARARPARRSPHRGRRLWGRGGGHQHRRRAAPRLAHARLGCGGVRTGSGDRRIELARSATAACTRSTRPTRRSRSAPRRWLVARMSSADRAAAPPRHLPPHADGARPAARAGDGGAAGRDTLAGGSRSACRPGLGVRILCGTERVKPQLELDVDRPARMARHDWRRAPVDMPAYLASGSARRDDGPCVARGPTVLRRRARGWDGARRSVRER